jgi:hypothetical protein
VRAAVEVSERLPIVAEEIGVLLRVAECSLHVLRGHVDTKADPSARLER